MKPRKPKKPKPVVMWAIERDGYIFQSFLRRLKKISIGDFEARVLKDWGIASKEGYRCIKVKVAPV